MFQGLESEEVWDLRREGFRNLGMEDPAAEAEGVVRALVDKPTLQRQADTVHAYFTPDAELYHFYINCNLGLQALVTIFQMAQLVLNYRYAHMEEPLLALGFCICGSAGSGNSLYTTEIRSRKSKYYENPDFSKCILLESCLSLGNCLRSLGFHLCNRCV